VRLCWDSVGKPVFLATHSGRHAPAKIHPAGLENPKPRQNLACDHVSRLPRIQKSSDGLWFEFGLATDAFFAAKAPRIAGLAA
jgi:hypothetical protein